MTCEVCRRPATKQCWTCGMSICEFCTLKRHWKVWCALAGWADACMHTALGGACAESHPQAALEGAVRTGGMHACTLRWVGHALSRTPAQAERAVCHCSPFCLRPCPPPLPRPGRHAIALAAGQQRPHAGAAGQAGAGEEAGGRCQPPAAGGPQPQVGRMAGWVRG